DRKLVEAFSAANIPLFKLQCPALKSFLREYTGKHIHDESHYRKMIPDVYSAKRKLIFSILRDKYIFLMFDETTDSNGKYIINILGGLCNSVTRERAYLIKTVEIVKINSITISQEIINIMIELYDGDIVFENLRLILSDGAPYAVKAVKTLKLIFSNLKHVTCLAHMIHRICEKIRDISPISNHISSEIKRLLIKNRTNQTILKIVTRLSIPKLPVLTRWGTWLTFMNYLIDEYDNYKNFLNVLMVEKKTNSNIFDSFTDEKFILELAIIKKHSFLINSIEKLEREDI
ncbi:hypothetical protein DMUE_6193, partial [Dictyocoela muelleri]